MAILIMWSAEAIKTFDDNIIYLKNEWTEKEIKNFVRQSNFKILNIQQNPKIYRRSEKNKQVRKTSINKNITLFYKFIPAKNEVVLLTFWHNRQNPKKLKY